MIRPGKPFPYSLCQEYVLVINGGLLKTVKKGDFESFRLYRLINNYQSLYSKCLLQREMLI